MTKPTYDAARSRGSEGKIGQLNPLRRGGQPDEIVSSNEAEFCVFVWIHADIFVSIGESGSLPCKR